MLNKVEIDFLFRAHLGYRGASRTAVFCEYITFQETKIKLERMYNMHLHPLYAPYPW